MDEILTCKYPDCNKYYLNPVILPCGNNVCKSHLNNNLKQFKCSFCDKTHQTSNLILNQSLVDILSLNLHFSPSEKEANKTIRTIEQSLHEFKVLNENPNKFIYEYCSNVKTKIELERDRLITRIKQIAKEMLDKLKLFEEKCRTNLQQLNDLNEQNKLHLVNLEAKLNEWKEILRVPKKNSRDMQTLLAELGHALKDNEIKRIEYKNTLLLEYGCFFNAGNLEINEDLFGQFRLDETVNIATTERSKDFGLYHSNILTPNEALNLIRLCEFSNKDNFRLIYRASEDGFNSNDFHKKCDGIEKTLTLIKTKEHEYVFGGYTQVAWDSSNHFKTDNNAFIFSLINKENRAIKINVEHDRSAIYCGASSGPSFGSGCDFEIVSNSDVNERSYSKLCGSYMHSHFKFNSEEANSFLAGKMQFGIEEIEVYQLVLHQ